MFSKGSSFLHSFTYCSHTHILMEDGGKGGSPAAPRMPAPPPSLSAHHLPPLLALPNNSDFVSQTLAFSRHTNVRFAVEPAQECSSSEIHMRAAAEEDCEHATMFLSDPVFSHSKPRRCRQISSSTLVRARKGTQHWQHQRLSGQDRHK
jgi:hypothetical protein